VPKSAQKLTGTPVSASQLTGIVGKPQPGKSLTLPKSVDFGGGHQSDVIWTVGVVKDTGKAAVNANGTLTALVEGTVTLIGTSTADSTKKITLQITIAKNVSAVRTPLTTLYLVKGKTLTLPVAFDGKDANGSAWGFGQTAKLTWKSSKASVATVNQNGKISAKKTGTVKITATALNGKKITITVKVVKKAAKLKKVTLVKAPKNLKIKATKVLKLKLAPSGATNLNITFKSSKPSVITVDKAGKLFALKKGKAKITVKAGGKKVTKTITVK
jgi:uncharacterized protein YjdB